MDKLTITIEGLTDILKAVFKPTAETVPAPEPLVQTEVRVFNETPPAPEIPDVTMTAGTPPAPEIPDVTMTAGTPPAPEPPVETEIVPGPPAIVELDTNGVPWDARINTSNKGQTAKGIWKRKPRLEDDFYDTIILELKNAQDVPAPASLDTVTQAAAMMAETPPPAPPAPSSITTFAELSEAIMTKGIPNETVTAAVNQVGLQSYLLLGGRPDLVPEVAKLLGL